MTIKCKTQLTSDSFPTHFPGWGRPPPGHVHPWCFPKRHSFFLRSYWSPFHLTPGPGSSLHFLQVSSFDQTHRCLGLQGPGCVTYCRMEGTTHLAETRTDWKQLVGTVWQVPGCHGWPHTHRCMHNQEFQNCGKRSLFRKQQKPTWPGGRGPAEGPSLHTAQLRRQGLQGGGGVWGEAVPRINPAKWWEITQWNSEEHFDPCLTRAQDGTHISSKVCKSMWSEIMGNRLKTCPRRVGVPGVRVQAAFLERE